MTLNLSDYEKGGDLDGDYSDELKAAQKQLAHVHFAHIIHNRRSMIILRDGMLRARAGLSAAWSLNGIRAISKSIQLARRLRRRRSAISSGVSGETCLGCAISVFSIVAGMAVFWWNVSSALQAKPNGSAAMTRLTSLRRSKSIAAPRSSRFSFTLLKKRRISASPTGSIHRKKAGKSVRTIFATVAKRSEYLDAYHDMFKHTDTRWAPWASFSTAITRKPRALRL